MEIIPVEYGKSVLSESMVFQGGNPDKSVPIVFMIYLIKTDEKMILADAGCETMPGFEMRDFCGPIKALSDIGVSAESITDIIITHTHHDHAECVKYFKNAKIHVQKDEYENGKQYFPQDTELSLFEDEKQICRGVKAVKIGGHSVGSCIVYLENAGKTYVIVGDECYKRKCIDNQLPTGASVCIEKSTEFIKMCQNDKITFLLCHDK